MAESLEDIRQSPAVKALKKSYKDLYRLGMIDREQYKKMIELIDKQGEAANGKPASEQK